jgi:hypothetical protein
MSNFLESLKSDLSNRRVLPVLVVLAVALVGALAYAVLGGKSSSTSTSATAPSASATAPGASKGIVVTQATVNTDKAVAETTSGAPKSPHNPNNPFKPLPGSKAKTASTSSPSSTSSSGSGAGSASSGGASSSNSSSSGSSGSSSSGSSGTSSTGGSKPAPAKPKPPATVHRVTVEFGLAATVPGQSAQLTSYANLKPLAPLPSTGSPLVTFAGVTKGGKVATFKMVGEIILHGPAECLPSTSQCLAIGLRTGQTEQLEYLPASGSPVVYELKLETIASGKASAAKAARHARAVRRARAARRAKAAARRARRAKAAARRTRSTHRR